MNTGAELDVTQILALVDRWAHAVRARDLNAIAADRAVDVLLFDVQPPAQLRGRDAYGGPWPQLFECFGADGVWEVRDVEVHAGDRVAFATALVDCVGRANLEARLTMGLHKTDGRWTVVHEHHSLPAP